MLAILFSMIMAIFPLSVFSQLPDGANVNPEAGSVEPPLLFDSNEILNVQIATDLNQLIGDIKDDPDYHHAILSYVQSGSGTISLDVRIKTRGNYRRVRSNCDFPPLLINFRKKEVKKTIFHGQNKIKLVTHCRTDDSEYEQLLYKEYLVYRLYNLFTPYSLRVRLMDVTYIDIWNPEHVIKKHAFLTETPEEMADRNGSKNREVMDLKPEQLDPYHFTLLALFQYMVINNDWSVPLMKNIKLVSTGEAKQLIPVPFDFDFAGFVNAPYRFTEDPEKDVYHDRIYYGPPNSRMEMDKYFVYFNEKRTDIYDLVGDFELLGRKHKTIANRMLNDFYDVVDQPESCDCGFYVEEEDK